jgi:hypothetical protein
MVVNSANGDDDVSYVYLPVGIETALFGLIYLIQHIKAVVRVVIVFLLMFYVP